MQCADVASHPQAKNPLLELATSHLRAAEHPWAGQLAGCPPIPHVPHLSISLPLGATLGGRSDAPHKGTQPSWAPALPKAMGC